MLFRLNHLYFQLRWVLLFCITWLGVSVNLFALPIKTAILNAEEQEVGQALVYIDYVELQDMEGNTKGRLGFVNIKGGFQLFVVIDDGKRIWSEMQKIGGFITRKGNCWHIMTGPHSGLTFMLRTEPKLVRQSALLSGVFVLQVLQATLPDFWINREYAGYLERATELD